VPNAALRFKPTAEMQAQVGNAAAAAPDSAQRAAWRAHRDSLGTGQRQGQPRGTSATRGTASRSGSTATLWYLDRTGKLTVTRVRTGLSDGQVTEVRGPGLSAGMSVIIGVSSGAVAEKAPSQAATGSPFQTQRGPRRGPGF
jgi:HlyD family secretion protein